MNIEKMTELAEWLEKGAPHVRFDMRSGIEIDHTSVVGQGECGSVCCIAGFAVQMTKGSFKINYRHGSPPWWEVRDRALEILGLPRTDEYDRHIGHALFDFKMAPKNCTPQQAAQAVRRMISNPRTRNPWKYVK